MRLEERIKNDMQLGNCIYIYGAGTVATDIYRRFKKAGIIFSGAVVDDAYFEYGKKLDDELEIFPIGNIQTGNVSVIAGNADYVRIRKKCDDLGIKNVYFLSRISYGTIGVTSDIEREYPEKAIQKVKSLMSDDVSVRNLDDFLTAIKTNDVEPILCKYKKQGYFSNDIFSVSGSKVLCDIGAYTGDTIRDFLNSKENELIDRIYAFEGNPDTYAILKQYIDTLPIDVKKKILPYNLCLWDDVKRVSIGTLDDHQSVEESLIRNDAYGSFLTVTLDSVLAERKNIEILKVNFLGACNVLKGARQIISEDRPDIIAAVGFSPSDLLELPEFIRSLDLGYKMYLRYNYPLADGLVLYSTIKEKSNNDC